MPKTKIVCTIGPASSTPQVIEELIANGMSAARLNFSHGTHAEHAEKIQMIRSISKKLGKPIAIMQDLQGPKIRVGKIPDPGIRLDPGQTFILTSEPVEGNEKRVFVSYRNLPNEVDQNDRILLADGMMEMIVKRTTSTEVICEVVTGGVLTSNKGINLPTGTIKAPSLTNKDKEDLLFGLKKNVDYVALSFVRNAVDIHKIKAIIKKENKSVPVIAKIEKHEALENIEEIMRATDGVMVARGDLGVEIPLENIPNVQKMLIRTSNSQGKPVIIATQMLRSMVDAPRPTRAEATDVANGVLDGTDAVMLSEETAIGRYPVEAVKYMQRIAESAELKYPHAKYLELMPRADISESVAYAACVLAEQVKAAAIVATTRSGSTAVKISRFRPIPKIIAFSPDELTVQRLALCWGCIPCYLDITKDTDEMIEKAARKMLETGFVAKGERVVMTAGRPLGAEGTTNMLWVKTL